MDEFQILAEAVVSQASKDYIKAIQTNNQREVKDLEKFFTGAWFMVLTDVDPHWLMDTCRKAA